MQVRNAVSDDSRIHMLGTADIAKDSRRPGAPAPYLLGLRVSEISQTGGMPPRFQNHQ